MSVYVDSMCNCLKNKNWPYNMCCHLIADSVDELLIFAERLGLKKVWFQNTDIPHFDLTVNMRKKAIKQGAFPISVKEFIKKIRKIRSKTMVEK